MSMSKRDAFSAVLLCALVLPAAAMAQDLGAGTPVSQAELARYFSIPPSGAGLPPGSGTAKAGEAVYAEQCSACHGDNLQGIPPTGGVALIGGRGTLASDKPVKTVESYWPYATTLFDYVWRAMPFSAPGSLTADQVYAVSAYVLARGKIIDENTVIDAKSLPKVKMPNADGFYDGRGPDLALYQELGNAHRK